MHVSSQLFESFGDLPDAWREICARDNLGMDPKVLRVFQRTLGEQCRCWGLVIFDAAGVATACAALCMFQTELVESNNPTFLRWRDRVRRIWPGFLRMKVLFCGLPVPSGSTHLCIRPGADVAAVVGEVNAVMKRLARTTGSKLMVFKELSDDAAPVISALTAMGYARGEIPPMHLLDVAFKDFTHYRDSLKSRYRAQVQRSQKKLLAAGFEVIQGRGGAFFAEHFDARVHALYIAVQKRAEQKLELMPLSFFCDLATELGDEALLTLIRREGRICAFTFAITRGHVHYNMYSGLDYAMNNDGDLYFNLFYHDMDHAFRCNATSLHLGQTSDAFKSRLGSSTQKLWFFARARSPFFNAMLHLFAPLAFPKVAPVEPNDVFTEALKVA